MELSGAPLPAPSGASVNGSSQPPHRYAAELDRAARVLIYCFPDGMPIILVRQSQLKCIAILQENLAALLLLSKADNVMEWRYQDSGRYVHSIQAVVGR